MNEDVDGYDGPAYNKIDTANDSLMVQQAKMAAQQKYMSSKGSSTPSSSTATSAPKPATTSTPAPTKSPSSSFTSSAPKSTPTPTKPSFSSSFNSSGAQARAMANRASQVNSYKNAAISQGTLNTGKLTNVAGIGGSGFGKSSK